MRRARRPVISYFPSALIFIIVGTAMGLGIGWVLLPVQFTNADPVDLRSSYKDDYVRMISAAFQLDGNVSRASQRLAQLGLGTPSQAVNDFIARESKVSKSAQQMAALADLARALGRPVTGVPNVVATVPPGKVSPTSPAALPTETLAAYRLIEHAPLTCVDEPDQAFLRIVVRDASGRDLPNVGIQVNSSTGEDIIYTGLKPERGIGYADVMVAPNTYTAAIVGAKGESATQLQIGDPSNCTLDRATVRGWKLVFQKQ